MMDFDASMKFQQNSTIPVVIMNQSWLHKYIDTELAPSSLPLERSCMEAPHLGFDPASKLRKLSNLVNLVNLVNIRHK